MSSKIIKTISKSIGIVIITIVIAFFLLFILIQQPKVQTWLVHQATSILSKKTGTNVSVGKVGIKFFKTVSIKDVYIEDIHGDTLAYIGNFDSKLSYFNPFKGQFHFNTLTLEGVRANIYRTEDDSTFNYQFLLDAFQKQPNKLKTEEQKDQAIKTQVSFKINKVHLADIIAVFDDKMGGEGHTVKLKSLDISARDIDINEKRITLNSVKIIDPYYVLSTYKKDDDKESKPFQVDIGWYFDIKKLQIENGHFGLHDHTKERNYSKNGFEFNWFDVDDIHLLARNLTWDKSIEVNLQKLTANSEANNVHLNQLEGKLSMSDQAIIGQNLIVAYNNTSLEADAQLNFSDFSTFSDFSNHVEIQAQIKSLTSNGKDVGVWAKEIQQYIPDLTLSGNFKGKVSDFSVDNFRIKAAQATEIIGDIKIKGVTNINQMLIDAHFSKIQTHSKELKRIVHYIKLPSQIDSLGNIRIDGSFKGTIHDFKTKANLNTDAGNIYANAHLRLPKNGTPSYNGRIQSDGITLSKFINEQKLNNVGFDLEINGRGFKLKNIQSKVKGVISNFEYNYYTYSDIHINGEINDMKFEGEAQLNDECAIVDFRGLVNLENPEVPIYKFYTKINSADLQLLNLIPNRLIVSIEGNFEFEGKDINDLVGRASLSNINLMDDRFNVSLSDLTISLDKIDDYKEYIFESEDIKGYMKGYFDPIKLPASLQFFFAQHTTLLKSPGIESLDKLMATQDVELKITVSKDIGIASLIDPKIKGFSDISVDGTYSNEAEKINLNVNIDSLLYDNFKFNQFKANVFDRNDSLIITSNLGSIENKTLKVSNIRFGSTSNLDGFYSRLRVENDSAKNNLELITIANFTGDSIKIRFPRSRIRVDNNEWSFNPQNNIVIVDSIFQLNNFTLQQGNQRISIENKQNFSDALVKIENLNIADIAQIFDSAKNLKTGILHADIQLKNVLKKPEIDGHITLEKIDLFDEKIDIINLNAQLSDINKLLNIDGQIKGEDYAVQLNGKYSLDKNNTNPIDIDVNFDKLSLKFLGFPFLLGEEISNLKANAKGNIQVNGSFKNIALDGKATIIDTASLTVNFLGSQLNLYNTDIVLKPRSIELFKENTKEKQITIFDGFNNTAKLSAKLEHQGFNNFSVDAKVQSNKFNFLNTTYKDNQDFFGKVYASGTVDITGPFDNINMQINATTLPNTEFNIVVAGSSNDQLYDFVTFVDRSAVEDTFKVEVKTKTTSALNLEMNINATTDAQLRMYLDYVKNDVIRARGSGELQLIIDPNGMQMFGEYTANSGEYLFSQQDIINKKFNIREGSTISWSGDVMDAKMNVDAFYSSRVNMSDIVDSTSNLRNRRFPVDVILNIGGTLANTDINFSLAPSKGQSNTPDELQAILDRVNNDPAQINTQAFSLILFNRFLNLQSTEANSQAGNLGLDMAVTTLSEFFNNKISEYVNDALSMLIPGAEVFINQGTDNTGIRVTQKLNNDRLIINFGGDVQYGNREEIRLQENNTGFIGDVEVEYLITEDGRIRAKAYSRYDNTIIRLENDSYLRSGIGITYQKEVDNFFDLFKIDKERRKRRKKKKQDEKRMESEPKPEEEISTEDLQQLVQ